MVGLSPWVEYEFRVVAGNSIGIGEPSKASELLRTKASGKILVSSKTRGRSFMVSFLKHTSKKYFYGSYSILGPKSEAGNQQLSFSHFYVPKVGSIFSSI